MEDFLPSLPGATALIERFGLWPSFHDAEVVSLRLNRSGASTLTVHLFRMTSQLNERGHYVCDLHTLVTFSFGEILGMNLMHFNNQNVLSGLAIEKIEDGFQLTLHPCYGLAGTIQTKATSISFEEWLPDGSVYAR
jgi:hypothetical protein